MNRPAPSTPEDRADDEPSPALWPVLDGGGVLSSVEYPASNGRRSSDAPHPTRRADDATVSGTDDVMTDQLAALIASQQRTNTLLELLVNTTRAPWRPTNPD